MSVFQAGQDAQYLASVVDWLTEAPLTAWKRGDNASQVAAHDAGPQVAQILAAARADVTKAIRRARAVAAADLAQRLLMPATAEANALVTRQLAELVSLGESAAHEEQRDGRSVLVLSPPGDHVDEVREAVGRAPQERRDRRAGQGPRKWDTDTTLLARHRVAALLVGAGLSPAAVKKWEREARKLAKTAQQSVQARATVARVKARSAGTKPADLYQSPKPATSGTVPSCPTNDATPARRTPTRTRKVRS